MVKIKNIKSYKLSSAYGNNKVFGQPKNVRSFVIVEILLTNGIKGYGESYQSAYVPELADFTIKYLAIFFKKKSINDALKIIKNFRIPFVSQSGFVKSILSSFEIALCDAKSKSLGIPFSKYLNRRFNRNEVKAYASGGSVLFKTEDLKKDLDKIKKIGLDLYKMRIGFYKFKQDINRINFVKNKIGNKNLMIDSIMGTLNKWNLKEVKKKITVLNTFKLQWLEEPFPTEKIFDYKKLKEVSKNPIAIGEAFTNFHEFENVIKNNLCDIVQPDLTQLGIKDTTKVVKLAKKFKKRVALHVWGSPISLMCNLHFALAHKEVDIIEYPLVRLDFLSNLMDQNIRISKNKISLKNKKPGLGFDLNNSFLKKYKFINNSGFKL